MKLVLMSKVPCQHHPLMSDPDANVPECNDFPASLVGQHDSYVIDNDYESSDSSKVVSKYQPAKVVKSVASRSTRSTSRAIRQPGSYISDNESSDSSEYSPTKVAALKSNRSCTSKMAKASASTYYVIDNDYNSSDSNEVVSKHQSAKVVKSVASRSTRSTSRAIRQPGSYISNNKSSDSSEYSPTKVAALKSNRSCTSKMAKASASNKCTRSKSSSKSKKNLQLNQRKNLQLNQGKKSLSLVRTILVKKMRLR